MFYRYDLVASKGDSIVYEGSFSSINMMVKFACGFVGCDLDAYDTAFNKSLPIDGLIHEFINDVSGL